ncbi:AtpZ/AtpI family protein [uncultured Chitinophaga sp.]|uniref:AtpZ/AtpI family protein n=1 Tax=uncultured Chitinophaga sp. TaxID=339340 RepID=UPI00345B5748
MEDPASQKFRKKQSNAYLRYIGLGFQLIALIGVALFAGYKIDQWTGLRFPLFMIVLSLLAIGLLLWRIVKDTSKHDR